MREITSSRPAELTIGTLSKEIRCKIETIRYYERIGVMPDPPRTAGGHRVYTTKHLKCLNFARRTVPTRPRDTQPPARPQAPASGLDRQSLLRAAGSQEGPGVIFLAR